MGRFLNEHRSDALFLLFLAVTFVGGPALERLF